MAGPMKIRAASRDGITEVKVLMSHEMETGFRKDATGTLVPAWFIKEVVAKLNDKVVMQAEWGASISKNPYFVFRIKGGIAGDKIGISWVDTRGETGLGEATVT